MGNQDVKQEKKDFSGSNQMPLNNSTAYDTFYNNPWKLLQAGSTPQDIDRAFSRIMFGDPEVRNTVLKNLKSIPYLPNREVVENALEDPRNNEKILRSIGSSLFYTCYPLYKLIRFYSDVLTYRYYIHSQGVKENAMTKPRFQREKRFVQQWIDKLNPERTFRRITAEVFREGKRAYVFKDDYIRDGKEKYALGGDVEETVDASGNKLSQFVAGTIPTHDSYNRRTKYVMLKELPDDYIKIVGVAPNSYYTIAFNFAYFMSGTGTNINDYPPIFKEYLDILNGAKEEVSDNRRNKNNSKKTIVSFNQDKLKQSGLKVKFGQDSTRRERFFCWVDMPSSEVVVFSSDESTPIQAPNFIGLYLMSADLQAYNILQQQLTGIPLNSIVFGSIPINEDNNKSPIVLDEKAVNHFIEIVNEFMPNGTRYVMTPSQDNKLFSFDEQPNATKVYTSALQDLIATSGLAGLLSTTDKPSLAQIKTSQLLEARYADVLYPQYEDCVNNRLERMTKLGYLRYDWKFRIFGDIFSDEKNQEKVNKYLTLGQAYYLPKALSYENMSICDAEDIANEVIASGVYDKMLPLISAFQQTQGVEENKRGRPTIDDSDIDNEGTAKSKDAGTNTVEGRVVNSLQSQFLEIEELKQELARLKEELLDKG